MNNNLDSQQPPPQNDSKKSHKSRRSEQGRIYAGQKFMEQKRKELEEKLNFNWTASDADRVQHHVGGTPTLTPLPITTRGIGLNIAHHMRWLQQRFTPQIQRAQFNPHSLYRVSLMQLKEQLYNSDNRQHQPQDCDPSATYPLVAYDQRFQSRSVSENLGSVASCISAVGTLDFNESRYKAYVPQAAQPAVEPASSKRKSNVVDRMIPDPYIVTIDNLRPFVEYLSDANNDVAVRRRFMMLDPIPGSRWNFENALLENPDEIIPAVYNAAGYTRDQTAVHSFFRIIKQQDNLFCSQLTFDGIGCQSMIPFSEQPTRIGALDEFSSELVSLLDQETPGLLLRGSVNVSPAFRERAMFNLMTERPVATDFPLDERWCLRSPYCTAFTVPFKWDALVGKILNTVPT